MKNDFLSKGRSVCDLKAHLVLRTKYRRKVFTGEMISRLHEIFENLLQQQECQLVSLDGEKDHVHLLFRYHPDIHLSKLVNSLDISRHSVLTQAVQGFEVNFWRCLILFLSLVVCSRSVAYGQRSLDDLL